MDLSCDNAISDDAELMMMSSSGNNSALLTLCEGNPPVTGGFLSQRSVTRSFDVFCDLHLKKRSSKQSRRQWFETPSRSLWLPLLSCKLHIAWHMLIWNSRDPFYYGSTFIPVWISNHAPRKLWDEIIYPLSNFNGFNCTVEVWEWTSNSISHVKLDATTYPCSVYS